MPAVPVPVAPLTVPAIVKSAKITLLKTVKQAGSGSFTATKCHRTAKHYGTCRFSMTIKMKSNGKKFTCTGTILVRDIGNGAETSYKATKNDYVSCNGKRVN